MGNGAYKLGKPLKHWNENAQTITFVVTEDCNLRCKYCYITHKASNAIMNFDIAKRFIDYILSDEIKKQKAVVIEFIGGEPLIEVNLIDQISDYFKIKAYEANNDWYWNYRFNISTNGVNYSDENVQKFINKNKGKLSIGISIDGTKEKHDSQRVFPNGNGSYDIIEQNLPLYISQFGGHTKATFSSDDLKYLKDSIISLWNKGITEVASNVIFEDAWKNDDDILFENQLIELADYALENHLFDKCYCTFFDENIGGFYNNEDLCNTYCGAGKMLAVGPNGNIYPCIRYKDYSLNKKKEWTVGNVFNGINMERVRPFMTATTELQSDYECINCEVAIGCGFCQGFNYDEAETPTNFSRAKYICKMHKARVRANDYYFSKLFNLYSLEKGGQQRERKRLQFILADDYISYCQYKNTTDSHEIMNTSAILKGLNYARQNFLDPIFIHSRNTFSFEEIHEYEDFRIRHIIPAKFYKEASKLKDYILVFEKDDLDLNVNSISECQFNIDSHDISNLYIYTTKLFSKTEKLNINIMNLDKHFDEEEYSKQLTLISKYLVKLNDRADKYKLNLFDDIIEEILSKFPINKHCKAGDRSFSYAPNEKLYICSAHYSDKYDNIGNIHEGITKFNNCHLFKSEYQPICKNCDAFQCINCIYLNESTTGEVNVSPSFQCRKGHIEREAASIYFNAKNGFSTISHVDYMDPIEKIINSSSIVYQGYYKY